MIRKTLKIGLGIGLLAGTLPAHGSMFDSLMDPTDGMLDMSDALASARGFLPVPIVITEPAIGYGLGAAVAYFHASEPLDTEAHPHQGPPSISVGLGGYTESDTWFLGAAHAGVWKEDHIRYTGALIALNINARYYGLNSGDDPAGNDFDSGVRFNSEGAVLYQAMKFRIGESNFWAGASYTYNDIDNTFRIPEGLPIEIPGITFTTVDASLGLLLEYDGRNTTFTPTQGTRVIFEAKNHDDTWGGDFEYDFYELGAFQYFPFGDYSSLGLRLEGQKIDGDAPFFAYPFVQLRGIRALRYQGESVVTGEAEYLWGFTPRWSVAFFGGFGYTNGVDEQGGDNETVGAGGLGLRYRLARKFGLQAGFDVARGPEETSFYITVGSAW